MKNLELEGKNEIDANGYSNSNGIWVRRCVNCNCDDWSLPCNNRGGMVCNNCGLTELCVFVNQLSGSDRKRLREIGEHDQTENIIDLSDYGIQTGPLKRSTRSGYKHMEYFQERIDQWAMQETPIPADDWEIFLCAFHDWCLKQRLKYIIPTREQLSQNNGRIAGTVCTTKQEIRDILVECENRCPLTYPDDGSDPVKNKFCRKYLEKWLSIRRRLCGVKSSYAKCPAWLIEALKEYFEMVVSAFMKVIHQQQGRKRMIGYNFVFRRLFDLFGFTFCCDDFPTKNTKSNMENIGFWRIICKYYQWPYINSDYNGGYNN